MIPPEKRKAKRGEFRTTKGKGTKDLRDRLKEITSRTRPPKPDIRKTLTDAFAGGIKGKPHSSPSGRAASVGRTIKRMGDYKEGGRIGLKSGTRRTLRGAFKGLHEMLGGSEKAKPHSTKEGRIASGKRRLGRARKKAMDDYHDESWAGKDPEKGKPHSSREGRIATGRRNFRKVLQRHVGSAKPLRAKHGIGSLVKKVITKIKPKPKGVFKPKPVPKAVTDVDRPFKGYDKSYTRADEKKINSMLKNLGDEIKAQPLPPKTKDLVKKLQRAYPHKKATGGRIGLKHGGSVGAAKRGHGAEIK